jgi:hypothetical protein
MELQRRDIPICCVKEDYIQPTPFAEQEQQKSSIEIEGITCVHYNTYTILNLKFFQILDLSIQVLLFFGIHASCDLVLLLCQ